MSGSNLTWGGGGGKHPLPSAAPGGKSPVLIGLIQADGKIIEEF